MKSRFTLLFVLAAFLNPISVFAVDYSNGKTACEDYVAGKILAADKQAASNNGGQTVEKKNTQGNGN
ncbi:MAG: hypothetical protein JST04_06740 [Bdellovibrionales bacterium]|nr:hypothetical protein [Bdellovibrionales bacterium]